MTPAPNRRRSVFSLKGLFVAVTIVAIVVNIALVEVTSDITSVARLMIAAGFLVGAAALLALRYKGSSAWRQWTVIALWIVAGWGALIVLGTSAVLLGSLLFKVFE